MAATKPRLQRSGNAAGREARTPYGKDLYSWASEQAALLRAGRLAEIDTENLADEIDDVGSAQYDKLESALTELLQHMLKWDHQPERWSRSWQNTIREQRRRVLRQLDRNPGLKSRLEEALLEAYQYGRDRASTETDLDVATFPPTLPYAFDEIMDRDHTFEPSKENH
jgi:predicted  nucleic acid-binding Zn-ribbon protein